MDTVQSAEKGRRIQEERSAETRTILLDATIECLVELGYARTTTTEIVRRAGVSRGAQVHHFPTKAQLVEAALKHLARRWQVAFRREISSLPSGEGKAAAAIDLLWGCYSGPLFAAALEFFVAARTDPELRKAFADFEAEVRRGVREVCGEIFGAGFDGNREAQGVIELTINLMNGVALERLSRGEAAGRSRIESWKRLIVPMVERVLSLGGRVS